MSILERIATTERNTAGHKEEAPEASRHNYSAELVLLLEARSSLQQNLNIVDRFEGDFS